MKKIGIMGGTFNPIHMGHLLLAQWAMDFQKLEEIWFIPTGCSYMKENSDNITALERLQMTGLAVNNNPFMKVLDLEVKREGYTYTYETMEELHNRYPEYHFYFIFGADCLFSIEKWKFPERIFANCSIIAAVRENCDLSLMKNKIEELRAQYQADIVLLPFLQLEISSTMIRERVAMGQSIRYLVPDEVISYIEEKGFYGYESK
ncbi:MAG: nicotinate-nucleotide adenylyltransferase [Lachnospiraceae bacterium]|nr:nicotinate-nucleotide adenylyltransferase [Lachnospiraceae bacterium]